MTGRERRRRKQLRDYLKERKGKERMRKLKEEALDHTLWRFRFGRVNGPVVVQTMK